MSRYLRIINVDGTDGSGKTTQIQLLAQKMRRKGIPCIVNHLDDNIESGIEICEKTLKFLQENEYGIVLNDGSIARMMVIDLVSGMRKEDMNAKYRSLFFLQEGLNHEYGTANVLLIMDDIEEANKRLLKRARMFATEAKGIEDFQKERDIVYAMRKFDIHTMSKGIKFDAIILDGKDSMMDVTDKIDNYLKENFEIKKPSE